MLGRAAGAHSWRQSKRDPPAGPHKERPEWAQLVIICPANWRASRRNEELKLLHNGRPATIYAQCPLMNTSTPTPYVVRAPPPSAARAINDRIQLARARARETNWPLPVRLSRSTTRPRRLTITLKRAHSAGRLCPIDWQMFRFPPLRLAIREGRGIINRSARRENSCSPTKRALHEQAKQTIREPGQKDGPGASLWRNRRQL